MAMLTKGRYGSTRVMKELGKIWAKTYDDHMLDHDLANRVLLSQTMALNAMRFGNYKEPIIGKRIFEMTTGTGSIIKALCDLMPDVATGRYDITANDISPNMMAEARKKLAGKCDVEFTSEDIRSMDFGRRRFDTIIWSQTLHMVVDPDLFAKEMDPAHPAEKTNHRQMKTQVIQNAFDLLDWGGYFMLIDEWPPKFTPTYTSPLETLVGQLFSSTFRPISDISLLRDDMMRNVNGARLVSECNVRIDYDHSMYVLVYVKDKDDADKSPALPRSAADARSSGWDWGLLTRLRGEVKRRIIDGFAVLDGPFRNHPINSAGHNYNPFNEGAVFDATEQDASRIENILGRRSKWDTIILPEILHKLDANQRRSIIRSAINALNPGGSIALMEEWPFNKIIDPHGIHKTDVRRLMMDIDCNLTLEGTLRERVLGGHDSGIYGFLYRVK